MLNRKTRFWNHSIYLTWYQRDQEYYLTDQEVLEPFCLTWYQRWAGFLFHFFVILEPFYSSRVRNYLSRKEENMTKSFQDFKKEYLEELGSEAKEEYNKALKL